MMEETYSQFTAKAAEGRHMPVEKLKELAGGRIYSGRQALDVGLVDQIGTLEDAIAEAKRLAGLEKDAKVTIERLPEPTNFLETLLGDTDAEKEAHLGAALEPLAPELIDHARKAYLLREVFDQPAALVMPFDMQIR
jgi:protease-4